MIIVTGASGQLGHAIVEKLAGLVPAGGIGASVRDPSRAQDLAALGVRVRQGDFEDPASLTHAFEGATQVLMVSSNAASRGGDALAQHRVAIAAAREAGARRIVYTSHMAASPNSAFRPMHDHAATEAMLARSGLAWTALRNGFYAASGLAIMAEAFKTGLFECQRVTRVRRSGLFAIAETIRNTEHFACIQRRLATFTSKLALYCMIRYCLTYSMPGFSGETAFSDAERNAGALSRPCGQWRDFDPHPRRAAARRPAPKAAGAGGASAASVSGRGGIGKRRRTGQR